MANILDDLANMFSEPANAVKSKGERNQNQGNIEDGAWARSQPGYKGSDGRFAIFESESAGNAAQAKLLRESPKYKGKSPAAIIQVYAPLGDNSEASIRNYIGYASARAGVDPDKPIPPAKQAAFESAMREFETGNRPGDFKFSAYAGTVKGSGMPGRRVPQKGDVRTIDLPPSGSGPIANDRVIPIANAEARAPEIAQQQGEVERRAGVVYDALDQIQAGLKESMATQETQMRETIAARQVLRDEQNARAEEVKATMFPRFARAQAIRDRREELAQMDPFSRALAGIFNPNYNSSYLNEQERLNQAQIDGQLAELDERDAVQNRLLNNLNAEFTDQNNLQQLVQRNLAGQLGLMQDALGVATAKRDATLQGLSVNGQVVAAERANRDEVLSQITEAGQVNTYMGQARASKDGTVMIGGVKISAADIMNRGLQIHERDKMIRLNQIAIEKGDLELQSMASEGIIKSMTPAERQKAAAANGMWQGQQLDVGTLNQYLSEDAKMAQSVISQAVAQDVGSGILDQANHWRDLTGQRASRAASVLGRDAIGPLNAMVNQQADQINRLSGQIRALPDGPAKQALQANLAQTIAKGTQDYEAAVTKLIENSSSDKEVQGVYRAWIQGAALTPDAAVRGFVNMTRSGAIVPGMSQADPAYPAVQAMRAAVKAVYDRNGGQQNFAAKLANKQTKAEMELQLQQAVVSAAQANWTGKNMDTILTQLPLWAKTDGHRASAVDAGTILQAQEDGQNRGIAVVAGKYNIQPAQLQGMLQAKAVPKGFQVDFQTLNGEVSAAQTVEMARALDAGWVAGKTIRPSKLLGEYMASSKVQDRIANWDRNMPANSMGATIVSTIAGEGALKNTGQAWAIQFSKAAAAVDNEDKKAAIAIYQNYNNDPYKRAGAIVASFPDLDPASETKILDYIQANVDADGPGFTTGLARSLAGQMSSSDPGVGLREIGGKIDNFVLRGEWSPEMKPYQRVIQKGWMTQSAMVDKAIGRLK